MGNWLREVCDEKFGMIRFLPSGWTIVWLFWVIRKLTRFGFWWFD